MVKLLDLCEVFLVLADPRETCASLHGSNKNWKVNLAYFVTFVKCASPKKIIYQMIMAKNQCLHCLH